MAIRRRKIESFVRDLLSAHQISRAPVPVEIIAKANGARISIRPWKMTSLDSSIVTKGGGYRH